MRLTLTSIQLHSNQLRTIINEGVFKMQTDNRNKNLFATSVLSAALAGALGEMEEYFDESQYIQSFLQNESKNKGTVK